MDLEIRHGKHFVESQCELRWYTQFKITRMRQNLYHIDSGPQEIHADLHKQLNGQANNHIEP